MNRPKLPVLVELPAGVDHGTPAGFTTGCRKPASCPAVYWHGMCCQYAHVREMTDNRYHAARRADPAPSAIARALGFRPVLAPEGLTIPPRPVTPTPPAIAATAPAAKQAPSAPKAASAPRAPKGPTPHGTLTRYKKGCRNDCPGDPLTGRTCRQVAVAAAAESKRKNPPARQEENRRIRAWAREQGIQVAVAGIIPAHVRDAYNAAAAAELADTEDSTSAAPASPTESAAAELAGDTPAPIAPTPALPSVDDERLAREVVDYFVVLGAESPGAYALGEVFVAEVIEQLVDVDEHGPADPIADPAQADATSDVDRIVDFARQALGVDLTDWQEQHLRAALAAEGGRRVLESRWRWRRFLTGIPTEPPAEVSQP